MSTTLEAKLREQLTAAMKAKDSKTANVIKMLSTKITERRTAKDFTGTVDDALVLDVIGTYKKSMDKARQEFLKVGERGAEQAAELAFEIEYCNQFLPQGVGEAELREAVAKAVADLPQKDPKMAGRVIGTIKKQYGDRADAALVKKLADELLAASAPS